MSREEELSAELVLKDAELAKAKRMMVALNNKVKAKLAAQDAKMKEEGDRLRAEIESLKIELETARISSAERRTDDESDRLQLLQSNWESERLRLEELAQMLK